MTEFKYPALRPHLEQVIGYLNFSSGTHEPSFFIALDKLMSGLRQELARTFAEVDTEPARQPKDGGAQTKKSVKKSAKKGPQETASEKAASEKAASVKPVARRVVSTNNSTRETGSESVAQLPRPAAKLESLLLLETYEALQSTADTLALSSSAFSDCSQVKSLLAVTFDYLLPEYRQFHADLLFHVSEEAVFQPFFIARCFELLLQTGGPWNDPQAVARQAIGRLNDYVGYRPVATLEQVKHQTYSHERFRPVPIFIRGAGISHGPLQSIVGKLFQILETTSDNILSQAHLDPNRIQELAIDIRAYDFDHPINKRPNYHFGLWDPDQIGPDGYYHRFIIHQITIDALLQRNNNAPDLSHEECEFEIAAALAGTMLMGACISGSAPDSHDSSVTLSSLLPTIANYRDDFYESLFESVKGHHRKQLEAEAQKKRQPFGGVRQQLNAELAFRRAAQVQHVQLSKIYAKMGYTDAAAQQASIVPVASARIICQIDCLLSSATDDCLNRRLQECLEGLVRIEKLLLRGIECGALLDPWCLLGFDGNFPLFPAIENSVPDHRADELVAIVEHTLDLYSHLLGETAANGIDDLYTDVFASFDRLSQWWRKYAAYEVSSLEAVDSQQILDAAKHVAEALSLWKKGGASAGDVAFWSKHAGIFDTPKGYQLVIDALLERKDLVASQALLIHWLSQASWFGLVQGETSYHELVMVWLSLVRDQYIGATTFEGRETVWAQVCKFYDFLEANADQYWQVPEFQLPTDRKNGSSGGTQVSKGEADLGNDSEGQDDAESDIDSLFNAAYENVVYNDSTDDGVEGQIFEFGTAQQEEMEEEADRIIDRLSFLNTLAGLWFEASSIPLPVLSRDALNASELELLRRRSDVLDVWVKQAKKYEADLGVLLLQVYGFRLPKGNGEVSALMEYDRLRLMKETVMDRIMATSVEMQLAVRGLQAVAHGLAYVVGDTEFGKTDFDAKDAPWIVAFSGVLLRDVKLVEQHFDGLLEAIQDKPLLYIPLSKGGDPHEMIETRLRQQCFQRILASLPLLGRFGSTYRLLEVARAMERNNNVGFGAVTEYDEMFRNGFSSMVQALILVAQSQRGKKSKRAVAAADDILFQQLEQLTEAMLGAWLTHSRTLRLSVMEKTLEPKSWENLVQFIKRYGGQLFTQDFLNLGNIRAILHQGVETWLNQLQESDQELDLELLNDLEHDLPMAEASRMLTMVLEAVIENFSEYRDYNSTTTQSDRGDLLYTFLDFIRLRTKYDRVAWHLKPVVWAHAILVKNQENSTAGRWRRQLAERVDDEANRYLGELQKLQVKYAMRMPTVADRLSERFTQPLHIDRICALVSPAMHSEDVSAAEGAFELLQKESETLTKQPMGVGLEVPVWLIQLEQEVDVQRTGPGGTQNFLPDSLIDPIPLSLADIQEQLDELPSRD